MNCVDSSDLVGCSSCVDCNDCDGCMACVECSGLVNESNKFGEYRLAADSVSCKVVSELTMSMRRSQGFQERFEEDVMMGESFVRYLNDSEHRDVVIVGVHLQILLGKKTDHIYLSMLHRNSEV